MSKYKYAVAQCGWIDGFGRRCGLGSSPSEATRILESLHQTEADANAALPMHDYHGYDDLQPGESMATYEVLPYDPEDYFPEQARRGGLSRQEMHRQNLDSLTVHTPNGRHLPKE